MKKLLAIGLFALSINCLGMHNGQDRPVLVEKKELFNKQEYQIYCATRRLADLVFVAAIKLNEDPEYPYIWDYFTDRRNSEEANPSWSKTQQGLFLEFYYGHPSSIHTPWGKWSFNGSTYRSPKYKDKNHPAWNALKTLEDGDKFHEQTLQQLGVALTLDVPRKQTTMGSEGPYYKVEQVEECRLPGAVYDQDRAHWNDDTNKVTRDKWKAMTECYNLKKK